MSDAKHRGAVVSRDKQEAYICEQLRASADCILGVQALAGEIGRSAGLLVDTLRRGGAVLTAGNGGSAAEALHMAEELTGRFRGDRRSLPGICLNADGTLLTCIGNDYGFEAVFARQVEGIGRAGDLLVLFSTSGQSENLVRAVSVAKAKGVAVIGVLGRDGGRMAGLCDVELVVQGTATERIQEAQQVLMHIWLDAIEAAFGNTEGDA
ncbi:MAG: SIS domain-containing protein [Kiritimatiellia bacterium]